MSGWPHLLVLYFLGFCNLDIVSKLVFIFYRKQRPTNLTYEARFSECTDIGVIQQPVNQHLSTEFLLWVQWSV